MPNLKEVVKVTATQMETLINGGTVGGHTLADDVLYAVERTGSLVGPTGPRGPTGPLGPTGPQGTRGPTGANGVGIVTSLNGSTSTNRSIYAPTSGGTSGYYLRSNGNAAPTWSIVKIDDGVL